MAIQIVSMQPCHAPQVAALEAACFTQPWSEQAFVEETQNPAAVYFVAVEGDAVVGFGGMHCVLDEGYITNIAVAEPHRRNGVGKLLLTALERHCAHSGIGLLTLEVRVSNAGAIALYESCGFAILGSRRGFYRCPTEDAYIMTKLDIAPAKECDRE